MSVAEGVLVARAVTEILILAAQHYATVQKLAGKSEAEIHAMLVDAIAGAIARDPKALIKAKVG
jgi:hypothetical protein